MNTSFSNQKTEAYRGESDRPQKVLPVRAGAELRSGRLPALISPGVCRGQMQNK